MSFVTFSKNITDLLSANVSKLQEVCNYEKNPFRGYPAACVTVSDNEGEYETSSENRRIYVFSIRLYEQTGRNPDTVDNTAKERADRVMRALVDDVITAFDENYTLGDALMVEAVPSRWGWEIRENNVLRTAEITLRMHKIVDIS